MELFNNVLNKIYSIGDKFIEFLDQYIANRFLNMILSSLNRLHAAALLISIGLLIFSSLVGFFKVPEGMIEYTIGMPKWAVFIVGGMILLPILFLLLSYLMEKFHKSCEKVLSGCKTYISHNAVLVYNAVGYFIGAVVLTVLFLMNLFTGGFIQALMILAVVVFYLILVAPNFRPNLIGLEVSDNSSAADDLIAILTFPLKTLVWQEKLISRILVIGSAVMLLISIFSSGTGSVGYFMGGLGLLFFGIMLPALVYFLFIFLFFFVSVLQAILAIPRIGK